VKAAVLLLLPALSWGEPSAPPSEPAVAQLHDAFIEAVDAPKKAEILAALSRTAPASLRDVHSLFDLFIRFPDTMTRGAALDSLDLMDPRTPNLDPLFLRYIEDTDPVGTLFAIRGALRIRSPGALAPIRKIAMRRFLAASPQDAPLPSERNAWYVQFEALSALAQWDPEKALPLIVKKTSEAPGTARILALHLWKESFPRLVAWASSSRASNRAKGLEALRAEVQPAALRATRAEMIKIVLDRKADNEVRHQLALKAGLCSTDEEAGALLKEYEAAADERTKLMLATALFASRKKAAIPLLEQYVKESPDPRLRAGALAQLKDMLPAAQYRPLLEWVSTNDPDPETTQAARAQLQ